MQLVISHPQSGTEIMTICMLSGQLAFTTLILGNGTTHGGLGL